MVFIYNQNMRSNQQNSLSKTEPQNTENPVAILSKKLASDMGQVNQIILEKMQSDVALIPQLAGYLIASGGKRIRPLLTLAFSSVLQAPMHRAAMLAACVEFIHTATLLHDDVVDESSLRRGQDSAAKVFGNQASVLVGDFLFSRAFELMVEDGSLDVLRILSQASSQIAAGEVQQLTIQRNLDTSLETYLDMIGAKTAILFAASCEVAAVLAQTDKKIQAACKAYGFNLGLAFQIIDDLLDYQAHEKDLGKALGDDLKEGKITAPVLYAYQNGTPEQKDFWRRVIEKNSIQDNDLKMAQDTIAQTKADQMSYQLAQNFVGQAIASLQTLPHHETTRILQDVARFSLERKT
jgi:octaprenyl-diphosphate synthase